MTTILIYCVLVLLFVFALGAIAMMLLPLLYVVEAILDSETLAIEERLDNLNAKLSERLKADLSAIHQRFKR